MRFAWIGLLGALACSVPNLDVQGLRCDAENPCGDGFTCADGRCVPACEGDGCDGGSSLCAAVVCSAPPEKRCLDTSTLRSFAPLGTCAEATGACDYAAIDTPCANGCEAGGCKDEPCAGVTCAPPPAPTCLDAATLRTVQPGTCAAPEGRCRYAETDVTCANGCVDGRCKNQDLCAGKTCTTPPAPTCVGAAVRAWSATGTCDGATGQCAYTSTDTPCPGSCQNAVCGPPPPLVFTQVGPKLPARLWAVDQAPGSSGAHVVAVGQAGYAVRWNGLTWTPLSTGTTQNLKALWLASTTLGYAVGQGGTILRYDGTAFTPVATGLTVTESLESVHGRGVNHVLVAGGTGTAIGFDGSTWRQFKDPQITTLASVYVSPAGAERLAGYCKSPYQRCVLFASSVAKQLTVQRAGDALSAFTVVGPRAGFPNDAIVAPSTGSCLLAHLSQGTFSCAGDDLFALTIPAAISEGASSASTYALTGPVQNPGGLFSLDSVNSELKPTLLLRPAQGSIALSRNESGGIILLEGNQNATTVLRRSKTVMEALEVAEDWASIAPHPAGGWVLLSTGGTIAVRPEQWPGPMGRSKTATPFSQVAAGGAFSLFVGNEGRLMKWAPGAEPSALNSGTSEALTSICRVSDSEYYAVGSKGFALKTDGVNVTLMSSGTTNNLTSVACLGPESAVAVGAAGTLVRLTGAAWAPFIPAFPDKTVALKQVGVTAAGEVYATAGATLWRLVGGSWTSSTAPGDLTSVVFRSNGELYATSGKSVLRLNGTTWTPAFSATQPLTTSARAGARLFFAGSGGVLIEAK